MYKRQGEGLAEKIFYLTAKSITATVALDAFRILGGKGYQAKTVLITAKEKMCVCEEMDCNPQNCPYAEGHFDRVNDAVFELLQKEEIFTRAVSYTHLSQPGSCQSGKMLKETSEDPRIRVFFAL